ncbi:MAG: aminotransferase class V-fold PLP-dependent enzyme [Alphaproteobacteria bacterium]|nr:aminotransferase class V-fold PLP-dependent enzyme [Alphaproteobacteria bacterium]
MPYRPGRHFLQVPGPTNIPERVLRAMSRPTYDHRSAEFMGFAAGLSSDLKKIFRSSGPVYVYSGSGTGAWEAALSNTLSPGDGVLMAETGHFATLWSQMATRLGLVVDFIPGDWRRGADPAQIEDRLRADKAHKIKAVCIVHNETSTGAVTPIKAVRKAIDAANHLALFFVDSISSLGSMEYRHDDWGVDVTIGCSQKGLMVPPGLGLNAVGVKALAASKTAKLPRYFWDWGLMTPSTEGNYPQTPSINLLFGLRAAVDMLLEEGLDNTIARHARLAEATRAAVQAWGLDIQCAVPEHRSNSVTAVVVPQGIDADALRKIALEQFDMALGTGLGKVKGRLFRIAHMGDTNDLTQAGALCGVEMTLPLAGIKPKASGVAAALKVLASKAQPGAQQAAAE